MFYFETFRIIPNLSSVKQTKQYLAILPIQSQDSVTQEITVWRKRRQKQNQDSQHCQNR